MMPVAMLRPVRIHWRLHKENGEISSAFEKAFTNAAYPYGAMNFRFKFVHSAVANSFM
jgi:hypothetical protein